MNNKLTIENEEDIKDKKKQHYIPCTYLSEFSPDRNNDRPRLSPIFYYGCEAHESLSYSVSIDSLPLWEKFLYELRDEDKNIISPHMVEDHLGRLECRSARCA